MARVLWAADRRIWKDDGTPATTGTLTFRLADTSTPVTVHSDAARTQSLGATVNIGSDGYLENDVTVYGDDTTGYDVVISATGVNGGAAWTIPDLAFAASTSADDASTTALRNLVPNGGFVDWTNGTSFTNASGDGDGDEVADGWYFSQSTAAGNVVSRQTASRTGARYGIRLARPNGNAVTNEHRLWIMLPTDEAYRMRGQTVTVSFNAHCGANFSAAGSTLSVKLATGTSEGEDGDLIATGGLGGHVNAISQSQAVTTSTGRYQFVSASPLGSSIKEVGLQFSWTPSGTAGANDWVQIEDVQIEIGAAATDFESSPEAVEFLRANLAAGGRLFIASAFADPGADRIVFWDESANDFVALTLPASGLSISGTALSLANDLAAYEGLSATGLVARTGDGSAAARTLTAPAAGITVSNGNGVSGNPTLALADDLAALEALTGTSTIYYRSGTSTWSAVSFGTGLSFSGGTLSLDDEIVDIAGLTPTDGGFIVGDGASFVVESGATARTSLGLGTAAVKNTGTSGDAVPLLNASNTHSGSNTFSGVVTHTGNVIETSADMTHDWRETGVAANEGNWRLAVNASAWTLYTVNDALNSFTPFLAFSRSGQTPTAATFGGVVLVPAGSASAPAVAGSADTNTGIYFPSSDVLGIATGGTVRWTVTGAGALVSQNSSKIYTADGSVGSPGFNFVDDQDNGLYRIGTNNWGLSAGGAKIVDIATTGIVVTGTIKGRTETSSEASGTLTSASANTVVKATGGITINDGVFAAGDHIEVYNDSNSSITITQDTGMTLRLAGTTSTGNRTLAARGIAIIYFDTNADATVGGTGVS